MIFQPTYFSPIYQFQKLVQADEAIFEVFDNYQKQSYRNRLRMYSANGILTLSIPVKHNNGKRQLTKDAKVENSIKWQKNHFNSIKTAYQSSPYFEFYEDDLAPLYEKPQKFLLDFILKTQELTIEMLQIDLKIEQTTAYLDYTKDVDARYLADAKLEKTFPQIQYKQVFEIKHGFIPHLSIIDLLFNEGPNAYSLLKL